MKRARVILAIALFIIVIGGGILYWRYTRSPEYSLRQAKKAFTHHDVDLFKKYVDVENLAKSVVDQTLETVMEDESTEPQNVWEEMGKAMAEGLLWAMKPRLVESIQELIIKSVETGRVEVKKGKKEIAAIVPGNLFNTNQSTLNRLVYVKREGKLAYAGIEVRLSSYDTLLTLEIKMRNKGNHWQISEITNWDDILQQIEKLEERRIAALNKPIIDKMENILAVTDIKKRTWVDMFGIDRKVLFKITFKNKGEKPIDEYEVVLTIKTKDGREIKKISIRGDKDLPPGGRSGGVWAIRVFDESDEQLFSMPQNKLQISVEIQRIKFTDGEELKLHKKWEGISMSSHILHAA